jgi:thiol:disulfide interchange protein DsbC
MIWCSPDRLQAWDDFFATGALPDNKGDCDNPVAATNALGTKLRVSATPTLVFVDGSVVPGALPAQRLEAELVQAETELAKLAAAKK